MLVTASRMWYKQASASTPYSPQKKQVVTSQQDSTWHLCADQTTVTWKCERQCPSSIENTIKHKNTQHNVLKTFCVWPSVPSCNPVKSVVLKNCWSWRHIRFRTRADWIDNSVSENHNRMTHPSWILVKTRAELPWIAKKLFSLISLRSLKDYYWHF